ncbi:MAG TPA: sulfocyanin-like copper-binding protein [Gemmatimonadales bacterium]
MAQSSFFVRRSLAALGALVVVAGTARAQGSGPASQPIEASWLKVDSAKKTADFQLTAGLTGLNGALNFNGFRDGGLTLTVPLNWTVELHFLNHDGMLPHSAEVIGDQNPVPTNPIPPAFDRAATTMLQDGLTSGQTDVVKFLANKAGSFLVFCGVPGHGAAGMWIRLKVESTVTVPTLSATVAPKKP